MGNNQTIDFERLVMEHKSTIYSVCYMFTETKIEADDLFQETSSVLWQKFDQFQPGTDFYAWACRTARTAMSKWFC